MPNVAWSLSCPKCLVATSVVLVEEDHALCCKCGSVWDLEDPYKNGYVCPHHKTSLKAHMAGERVHMNCPTCGTYYVIPRSQTLDRKVGEAFTYFGELE